MLHSWFSITDEGVLDKTMFTTQGIGELWAQTLCILPGCLDTAVCFTFQIVQENKYELDSY